MTLPSEDRRTGAQLVCALVLFVASLAYFLLFLRYGINIEDEGTLLYQFERLADGQRPYVDFHLGYTPGVYYIHSFLQGAYEHSVIPGRIALAITNSASVALLGALVVPYVGLAAGLVAGLCYLAIPPVNPGFFASFNVPYPTWYSVTVYLAGLLVCRGGLGAPSAGRALVAGVLAGVGFLFKPNIGAFQLACTMLLVLASLSPYGTAQAPQERRLVTAWWWAVWAAALLGVFGVFGFAPRRGELTTFLLPAMIAAVLCFRRARCVGVETGLAGVIVTTSAVMVGFVAVNAPWIGYYATSVPLDLLLREVFFIGSDYADFFYRPHPIVLGLSLQLALGALIFVALPRFTKSWLVRPARLLIPAALVAVIAVYAVLSRRPMVEGLYNAVMGEVELFWIYPVTLALHWLAFLSCRRAVGALAVRIDSLFVLTVGSALFYLQIYPRTDFMHWVTAAPLVVGIVVCLARIAADAWAPQEPRIVRGAVVVIGLLPLLFVAALRFDRSFSTVLQRTDAGIERRPSVELAAKRAPVWMNIGKAERYRDIDKVVEILDRVSSPDDKVLMFPALDLLSFLADRHSPIHDTYFFPRWVGHDDEADILTKLQADPPPFVVVHHELWPFFDTASLYYFQLTDYLERDYRKLAQVGRFAILAHRDREGEAWLGDEIAWGSADPRLSAYVSRALDGKTHAARAAALSVLAHDLIEGYYEPIVDSLDDDDRHVREAAVRALRTAENDRVGAALLAAASEGRLTAGARTLALRRGSTWAARESVPVLIRMADDADMYIADAGASGLGAAARRTLLRSVWPHHPPDGGLAGVTYSNAERLRIRAWLREPLTDVRTKAFAVSQVLAVGALEEVHEIERSVDTTESPDSPGFALSRAVAQLAPQPLARARMIYELAHAEKVDGVVDLALDYVTIDDMVAPRAVVESIVRDPRGDAMLADRVLSSDAPVYIQSLLYAGAVSGGCATVDAARSLLSSEPDERVAKAARRVLHEEGRLCLR